MTVRIFYSSVGGNTKIVVSKIKELLESKKFLVELIDCNKNSFPETNLNDIAILASPTYNQGTLEKKMENYLKINKDKFLDFKFFAVVGLGDLKYYSEYLTESATILEQFVNEVGGKLITNSLRINGLPYKYLNNLIPNWVEKIIKEIS